MKVEKYFIYVGNAYPHKNLKRLIEAVVMLNKNIDSTVGLIIVSSRSIFTQRLNKTIADLNASKLVTLSGPVSDSELQNLYRNSVGFVFPSLSEGFGLPGIEAMRENTIVMASDIPVFREVYRDNAIYFNPLDFTSIEKAMKDVLEMEKEEKNEREMKAKEFVKRYSWSNMAKETLKIYEESSNRIRQGK